MKAGIHPKYYVTEVNCGCGASFVTRSTRPSIKVEICSECHPFYTGRQKFVDTAGRVEKFTRKYGWSGGQAKGQEEHAAGAKKGARGGVKEREEGETFKSLAQKQKKALVASAKKQLAEKAKEAEAAAAGEATAEEA